MSALEETSGLSIGEIASRAGVAEGTLRMWEARYRFPLPQRLPSGHRRYSERDLEQVRNVVRSRDDGLPLAIAIDRARRLGEDPQPSVYGALREKYPYLHPHLLTKRVLVSISHAIEDECAARSPHPVLFACFQHERFYRQAQPRWREISRSASRAIVLADFARLRRSARGPVEVPIAEDDPLMREWVVVCDAPQLPACMVGWERPDAKGQRRFETIWTVEPAVVREAARVCCMLAGRVDAGVVEGLPQELAEPAPPVEAAHLRAAVELATRAALYATGGLAN